MAQAKKELKVKKVETSGIPLVEDLFNARVHLGHQSRRWSPKMASYIFSKVGKSHILDLEKTHKGLENAYKFLEGVKESGGKVIIVGTKRQAKDLVKKYAKQAGAYYVEQRWVGGILTNNDLFFSNIKKLEQTKEGLSKGEFENLTKKERLLMSRKVDRDEKLLGGLFGIETLPKAVIIVDPRRENVALREANRMDIPVVGIVDTNTNPDGVDYVIPANDDAISSLDIVLSTLVKALE